MEKLKKLQNIEFLRVVFILILIYCHLPLLTRSFPDIGLYSFISGHPQFSALAVDFFFILSGFFLKYTMNTELDAFDFLKKKFKRLWAVVALAVVCYWCLNFFNIESYGTNLYNSIFSFFFVDNIGITLHHCGPSWYVSVLVLVSLFYFYMYKALPEKVVNLIIGFLVWFSYTFTINTDCGLICEHIGIKYNILCMGLLRGLGGMGLGVFLHYTFEKFKNNIADGNKILYTILEIGLLGWILYAIISVPNSIKNSMIFIIAFLALIWLFLIKQGYLSRLTDNKVFEFIGKYTYSIFLTHIIIIYILYGTTWNNYNIFIQTYPIMTILLLYFVFFMIGIITYHIIEKPENVVYKKLGFMGYYCLIFASMLIISGIGGHIVTHMPLKLNTIYSFSVNHKNIHTNGLSNIENWGRWSDGDTVDLKIYVPKEDIRLDFDIEPYLNEFVQNQKIDVYCKNHLLGTWQYKNNAKFPQISFNVPKSFIKKNGKLKLIFRIENTNSPKSLGLSNDGRELGIGFKSMVIKRSED